MRRRDPGLGRTPAGDVVAAATVVARLRASLPASALVLFGSRATDEYTQLSDYDLAVVSPAFEAEPRMFRRSEALFVALGDIRRVDPVGLAPSELAALDCLLVLDVVADGVALHDEGCFAAAKQRLAVMRAAGQVERLRGGWRLAPAPAR